MIRLPLLLAALLALSACQVPRSPAVSAGPSQAPRDVPTDAPAAPGPVLPGPAGAGGQALSPGNGASDAPTPGPYRYLGRAHYEGRPLLGTEGEFAQLAIAPGGRQVVFVGRDDRDAYQLFLAGLDGAVRHLAAAGLEPQRLALTGDALVYLTLDTTREGMRPGAPPDVPGIPSGYTVHRLALADGTDRVVTKLPRVGVAFPDPTGAHVALWAFTTAEPSKLGAPLDLLDVATGARRTLMTDMPLPTYDDLAWRADGQALAVALASTGPNAPGAVRTFTGPAWAAAELARAQAGAALWWDAAGTGLEGPTAGVDQGLALEAFGPGSDEAVFLALPPPTGAPVLPSPGRTRYLLRRDDGLWVGERATGRFRQLMQNVAPVGWLDEDRFMAYAGGEQRKRLEVVDLRAR